MTELDRDSLTRSLSHFRWRVSGSVPGRYELWENAENTRELVVPLDPQRRDYDELLHRAFRQFVGVDGTSGANYYEAMLLHSRSALDFSRWRKESNLPGGVIPWTAGERHFQAVRESLVAVAKSSRRPRRHHGAGSAFVAQAFLDEVLMGQTQVGSFVVTAHIPSYASIPETKTQADKLAAREHDAKTISTATILDTLQSALSAAQECIVEYKRTPNLAVWDEAVDEGFSFELARALVDLTSDGDCSVEIERAPDLITPSRRLVEFAFEAPDAQIFEKVASRFVEPSDPREVTLAGAVTLLSTDMDHTGRVHVIRLLVGRAGINKVRVRLTADQYSLAMEAHQREVQLRVQGQLTRDGNLLWITNQHDVEVLETPTTRDFPLATLFDDDFEDRD